MINRKVAIFTLAFLLVFVTLIPLTAQESSAISPAGQTSLDGRSWLSFTSSEGMRVLTLAPFPEEAERRLEITVAVVSAWSTIRVTELRAESSKGVDDYVLSFSSIISDGRDYSDHVPGGLRLRYDGALMYDFRVRSGDYFVRVSGVLMDEAALISEIVRAVNNPGAFIAERDPSWLALRIHQLDSQIKDLNALLSQAAEHNAAKAREIEALIQLRTSQGEALIEERTAAFTATLEAMAQESAAERSALEANFGNEAEVIRRALAAEMNKGLLGKPKPLNQLVFDHVMTLKSNNSGLDRVAALESAKTAGLKPRSKEIDIIFRVWFGE